jgi:hypothetical protein
MIAILRILMREFWLQIYNRLVLGRKTSITKHFITVRLLDGNVYFEPCAFLPEDGILAFWDALGVADDAEEKLRSEWDKGNWIPVAPEFPLLSELIEMQIDNTIIKSADMPELLREIAVGRERCTEISGLAVFDELEKAAALALAQAKGISLSPFG